mmetsp:Transcript_11109/g.5634  ORF Transcript_11109/g.5634 Transcript_11109/m.5634 type:complete len:87 (-) Transcript_11109:68-328(-)
MKGDARTELPLEKRKITDIICLITIVVSVIGITILAVYTIQEGDVNRLTHGHDFRAELCGVDDLSHRPFVWWPEPEIDMGLVMCVE